MKSCKICVNFFFLELQSLIFLQFTSFITISFIKWLFFFFFLRPYPTLRGYNMSLSSISLFYPSSQHTYVQAHIFFHINPRSRLSRPLPTCIEVLLSHYFLLDSYINTSINKWDIQFQTIVSNVKLIPFPPYFIVAFETKQWVLSSGLDALLWAPSKILSSKSFET